MYIAGPHNGATENARPGSVRRGVSTNNDRKSEEPADRGDDANDHGSKQSSSPSHAHLRSNPRSTKTRTSVAYPLPASWIITFNRRSFADARAGCSHIARPEGCGAQST